MSPTVHDAAARALVRLPDGRCGRVVYVPAGADVGAAPGTAKRRGSSTKAKVVVAGAYLSFAADQLEVVA